MTKVRQDANLAMEPLHIHRQVATQDLDRHRAVVSHVSREIDRGHTAGAELSFDDVAISERSCEIGRGGGHAGKHESSSGGWRWAAPCESRAIPSGTFSVP